MADDPHISRRTFMRSGALALAGATLGARTLGATPRATGPGDDDMPDAVRALLKKRFGSRTIRNAHVSLDLPEVAPDAREVPIFIETDLPMEERHYVKTVHLIVDHNPDIYLAGFNYTPAMGAASIDTRIKLRRSTHVRAIAETNTGELYGVTKFVYTTLNGCV
ncbi:MAG TPA: thiosulfate oxidation carrier protein SoxY [Gemmatimonadaceae bacterium]|jgi:sulfur-oxidizing protein SoxY|nr:thiosulfate oxidation carrier protein SoxY [Gemmatimonadaceae bacterium]